MLISDWSSDVCSSDLLAVLDQRIPVVIGDQHMVGIVRQGADQFAVGVLPRVPADSRTGFHTFSAEAEQVVAALSIDIDSVDLAGRRWCSAGTEVFGQREYQARRTPPVVPLAAGPGSNRTRNRLLAAPRVHEGKTLISCCK